MADEKCEVCGFGNPNFIVRVDDETICCSNCASPNFKKILEETKERQKKEGVKVDG